jgi:hypothetical protein
MDIFRAIEAMKGRKLAEVKLAPDKESIVFSFQDGHTQAFEVYGDCCSRSWIEHLELPGDVDGATLLSVKDSDTITQDHEDHDEDHEEGGGCVKVYNTVFHTDRGDIVLEFRNSSNGYYGGYLDPA